MKILLSHPTGNANVRAVAKGFSKHKLLGLFCTSIAAFPQSILYRLGGLRTLSELRRRSFDKDLQPFTKMFPITEMGRIIAGKMGWAKLTEHEKGLFCIDKVYRDIDKKVAKQLNNKNRFDAVYAYEDGALATFKRAKELDLICIYDLPIAYWETGRRLMQEEALRLPAWAVTLGGGIADSEAKLERKRQEMKLADIVVVPGKFVMDSLPVWAKNKQIIVSPFGSPQNNDSINFDSKDIHRSLKVLFVGSMGQRKGLGDLFEAMKLVENDNVELIVLGSLLAPMEFYRSQYANFTYEPGRSHDKVLELMRSCDVFCLPSLVEGRALVMQEAMSQGLPLIITPNTGGEDLVIEGETGFLVPIRSPQAIAEKISWYCEHRDKLEFMSIKAYEHSQTYTWENYASKIITELENN